jgi:NAD(P)-dependent dehydrogenase (short-subunit alcohol dehydrogenase family)
MRNEVETHMSKSKADSGLSMKGKICIVTGANSGLGRASALALAQMGANVVMLCRNRERGEAARIEIQERSGNENVELILADLGSQASVRQFVATFEQKHDQLQVLLNCAGIRVLDRRTTKDGLELMFGSEYLGHFLLTNLLVPALIAGAPSRVITVSGEGHKSGVEGGVGATMNFDDLQYEKSWSPVKASKQVVLAKILFTYELARRLEGTGVAALTVSPPFTRTNLSGNYPWFVRAIAKLRMWQAKAKTAEEGARCLVQVATDPEIEGLTGKYFVQGKLAESSVESYDLEAARRLWQISEGLVGQSFSCQDIQPGRSSKRVLASSGAALPISDSELVGART